MARKQLLNVEQEGLSETLKAFQGLEADLRRTANGELRSAAGDCAGALVGRLQAAAGASGVPVAPRVASSIRVKSDRLPSVSIGGTKRVGAGGAQAGALVWGSEHGGRGDVNHFAAPPSDGYWIKPTVTRFRGSDAIQTFTRAVFQIMRKWRLV